jgi:hypothetical protein
MARAVVRVIEPLVIAATPLNVPEKLVAVIVPAEKLPEASRATILLTVLVDLAGAAKVPKVIVSAFNADADVGVVTVFNLVKTSAAV